MKRVAQALWRPVDALLERVRRSPWCSFVWVMLTAAVLGLLMNGLAPHYNDAQTAAGGDDFRATFAASDRWRYVAAGIVDLGFAATYAVVGTALAFTVGTDRPRARRIAVIGAMGIIGGVLLDELENLLLFVNILRYHDVGNGWIGRMAAIGEVKWTLGVAGALVVVAIRLLVWVTVRGAWDRIRTWIARSGVAFGVYLALVVATFAAAVLRQRPAFLILVPAMFICGSWLNGKVAKSRRERVPAGHPRVLLALAQLAMAVGFIVIALADRAGTIADAVLFLAIALGIMALGALVSEARDVGWLVGPIPIGALFVTAIVCLGVAVTVEPKGWGFVALLGVGLLAGELGTELASEWYCATTRPSWRPWLLGFGGVLALGGLALLLVGGLAFWWAIALCAFLLVVVLMASVDGDGLALVAVLVLALFFATQPLGGTLRPELEPEEGQPYILVVGDSYISGEGATRYLPGTNEKVDSRVPDDPHINECRRAPTAWPFGLAESVEAGALPDPFPSRLLFLACSGGVTEDIAVTPALVEGVQKAPAQLALYERQEADLGAPALVIVGIGGNDAGFGDVVSTCIGPGNCAELADYFLRSRPGPNVDKKPRDPEALANIGDDLVRAYTNIRQAVGDDVPIVAVSYPIPIDDGCWDVLLDEDERTFVQTFARLLNEQVRLAAATAGVHFMDISDSLLAAGAGLCGADPGLNFLAFASVAGSVRDSLNPKNWIHNSVHPNARGHEVLAQAAVGWLEPCVPLAPAPAPVAAVAPDFATGVAASVLEQCTTCTKHGDWTVGEVDELYDDAVGPLALVTIGLALLLAPLVQHGRRERWNLWKTFLGSRFEKAADHLSR